jgi:hypothetical protein
LTVAAATACAGLEMFKTVVEDTPNKIFIEGLPGHYTYQQVRSCTDMQKGHANQVCGNPDNGKAL